MTISSIHKFAAIVTGIVAPLAISQAQVRVITTSPAYADIARNIGEKYVSVEAIMRGPENPHNVQPKPSEMMKMKDATLFVHTGLDGEAWAPLLVKGARNEKLLPGQPGNVDVSRGIQIKEVPSGAGLTRALGDIHAMGNPHYSLDPLNGVIIARTITDALKQADPKHAAEFEQNFNSYSKKLRDLSDELVKKMLPFRGTKVVTYHRAWVYFLDRFGLVSIGEVEPKPGITPGPQHLAECVDRMKAQDAKVIIVETFSSKKDADFVAEKVGGKAVVLAQDVNAIQGVDTYEKMFRYDIDTLTRAFEETGAKSEAAPSGPTGQ
jgi:ABC-type Zn uptake system ZnuABC Zn-binding protein ZnuA